jgi:hypothetical protein
MNVTPSWLTSMPCVTAPLITVTFGVSVQSPDTAEPRSHDSPMNLLTPLACCCTIGVATATG